MPLIGLEQAIRKTQQIIDRIQGPMSEKTVTEICIIGSGYAALMTPVDTSLLINSQFGNRKVAPVIEGGERVRGTVGYTAAYAAAVNKASGKLKGKPRPNNRGTYWAPGGEPDFLRKGFEVDGKSDIAAAVKRGMAL